MKKMLGLWLGLSLALVVHAGDEGGGNKVERGVERGAKAAANGIEKGVDATGRGVNKAVEVTGRGLGKVGNWINSKVSGKGGNSSSGGDNK